MNFSIYVQLMFGLVCINVVYIVCQSIEYGFVTAYIHQFTDPFA